MSDSNFFGTPPLVFDKDKRYIQGPVYNKETVLRRNGAYLIPPDEAVLYAGDDLAFIAIFDYPTHQSALLCATKEEREAVMTGSMFTKFYAIPRKVLDNATF